MSAALHQLPAPVASAPPRVAVAALAGADGEELVAALARAGLEATPLAADGVASRLGAARFDVLVLAGDIERPATAAVLRRVRRVAPGTRVVVAASAPGGHGPRRALNLGADGVAAAQAPEALAATVRAVLAGQVCVPRGDRRTIAKPSFSHREKEILALVTIGSTNQEIAARLYLTESTVKSHLATAFEKLGVRSRTEAASLLLDPEEGLQATALPPAPLVLHAGGAR